MPDAPSDSFPPSFLVFSLPPPAHSAPPAPTSAHCPIPARPPLRAPLQVVHSLKAGVVEPAMSKVKSLRFACEAAITILRIDDFIKIDKPQQGGGR